MTPEHFLPAVEEPDETGKGCLVPELDDENE